LKVQLLEISECGTVRDLAPQPNQSHKSWHLCDKLLHRFVIPVVYVIRKSSHVSPESE